MNAFEADLKRAFAEIEDPADDGFAVAVGRRVAHKERNARLYKAVHPVAGAVAGVALAFGAVQLAGALGPELLASLGLELARAHGALTQAEGVQPSAVAAVLTGALGQFMLAVAAAAGGLAAVRAVRE